MPTIQIGQTVGSYHVIRQIGAGGMGIVFEVEHLLTTHRAALKVLTVNLSTQPDVLVRFQNEARAAGQLKHPGVIKIFDFGHLEDGTQWVIMEYLEGESLAARMAQELRQTGGGLDMETALRIGLELASALDAVHGSGIVHRDLKPSNVMLVPDPVAPSGERAKLLDFGIAKFEQGQGDRLTRKDAVLGTPDYMAPEQFESAADVDGKADVHALGVILFQMLSGLLPYKAEGIFALMAAKKFAQPAPLGQLAPKVPQVVAALVMRILSPDPAQRPSMMEVELELRRILGLPPPRPSGYHHTVAGPAVAPTVLPVGPIAHDANGSTGDIPSPAIDALQALGGPTPSGQGARGELSPRSLDAPISLGSMPSVPIPAARAPTQGIAPLVAGPDEPTAKAPDALPVARVASPSAPTVSEQPRRRPLYLIGIALTLSAALSTAVLLWPRRPPAPTSRALVAHAPPATQTVATPAAPVLPPEPGNPAREADAEPLERQAPTQPVVSAPVKPITKTTATSRANAAPAKTTARRRQCGFPPPDCVGAVAITEEQRKIVAKAIYLAKIQMCKGDRLRFHLEDHRPVFTVPPSWLSNEEKADLLLSLKGWLKNIRLIGTVTVECEAHLTSWSAGAS